MATTRNTCNNYLHGFKMRIDELSFFSNMRRDTLVALGGVCLIFWAGIYFLFSLKPGQVGSQDKLEERSRFVQILRLVPRSQGRSG